MLNARKSDELNYFIFLWSMRVIIDILNPKKSYIPFKRTPKSITIFNNLVRINFSLKNKTEELILT